MNASNCKCNAVPGELKSKFTMSEKKKSYEALGLGSKGYVM